MAHTSSQRAVATSHGPARVQAHAPEGPDGPRGAVVLGHGAGGGVDAPDLVAVTAALASEGWTVVLVEQPYRVAGRKAPPRADVLDAAWCEVVAELRAAELRGLPLVVGGRSAGARVACRTAGAVDAVGVVCLAFPTRPPGRPDAPTRVPELTAAGVPVLVVQGATDPYGEPPTAPDRTVQVVRGDHSLRQDTGAVTDAVRTWLDALVPRP